LARRDAATPEIRRNRRRSERLLTYDIDGVRDVIKQAPLPLLAPKPARGSLGPSDLPMIRTSERSTFKRCRWLWKTEFIDLRKPLQDTPPLMFGSMIHVALHGWYPVGLKRSRTKLTTLFEKAIEAEAVRVTKNTGLPKTELYDQWADRIELGLAMLGNYLETFGKDDQWEVLASELPFKVIVTHPRDGKTPWFWYTGILDLLILDRATGLKEIIDHKTAAAITTKYLALDDQTTSYWTYGVDALRNAKLIGPTEMLNGLRFNFLRKAKPDERTFVVKEGRKYYTNLDGNISKKQPSPYFLRELVRRHSFEKERTRLRVQSEMLDMESVRREPDAGAYKNPGKFTCPGCWLFDVCELHEVGADWETVRAQQTVAWDPYAAHSIYEGEAR
jgi:hypothetical protein